MLILPDGHQIINAHFYEEIAQQIANNEPFAYLFKGNAGTGKTELLKIIAENIKPKPRIISHPDLWQEYFTVLCSDYTDKSDGMQRRLDTFKQPILFVDDIGAEIEIHSKAANFTIQAIHILCNAYERFRNRGELYRYIFTSNTKSEHDREAYGDRVFDRFLGIFKIVKFPEKSFRENSKQMIDLTNYRRN